MDSYPVMSSDGTGYALTGKQLIHAPNVRNAVGVMPPFYSFMIGLFSLATDNLETAARSVSVFFSTLTIVPLYLLARRYFGTMVAIVATVIYVFLPFMHSMSGIDISEPTYTFLLLTGLLLAVNGMTTARFFILFISGIFIGLAYLTRPEALVFFGGLWLNFFIAIIANGRDRLAFKLTLLLCLTTGWLAISLPYVAAMHSVTGKWQISGKVGIGMQLVKERYGIQGAYESQYRLDGAGKLAADKDFDTPFSLLRARPDIFLLNIRDNLLEFPGKIGSNVPYYLILLAFIGFFKKYDQILFAGRLPLFCTFLPLISYLVFTFDPRYFYPYVPILLVFVAAGIAYLADFMTRRFAMPGVTVAVVVVALLAGYYLYLDLPKPKAPYDFTQDGGRFDDKQVGLRLKQILPSGSKLMTRSSRVGFYADMPIVIPPEAEFSAALDYARKNGVTHIVANMQLYAMRPAFAPLFLPLIIPGSSASVSGLEMIHIGQEPGGQPYLVYRLR